MADRLYKVADAGLDLRLNWDKHLQKKLIEMEKSREGRDPVRMSASGSCQRKLWYQKHHGHLSSGFGTRMLDSFAVGDAVEQIIKFRLNEIYGTNYSGFKLVCKQCRAERTVYTQECAMCGSGAFEEWEDTGKLEIEVNGTKVLVPGRIDGKLTLEDGKVRIAEVKTMANYTFGRLKGDGYTGEVDYSYACQAAAYQKAFGIDETIFIGIRKETGEVCFRIFKADPALLDEVKVRFANVLGSNPDEPLPREYAPKVPKSPKGVLELTFPCSYCDFAEVCWPTFTKEFVDKKDFGTGSVSKVPVYIDRSGRFATPEAAQASIAPVPAKRPEAPAPQPAATKSDELQ